MIEPKVEQKLQGLLNTTSSLLRTCRFRFDMDGFLNLKRGKGITTNVVFIYNLDAIFHDNIKRPRFYKRDFY